MVPDEEPIGRVVDYDEELNAARVHLEEGDLRVGDKVHITGPETDVEERVEKLQLPTGPADEAQAGDDVGLQVPQAVEEGAQVLREARSSESDDPYDTAEADLLGSVFDE